MGMKFLNKKGWHTGSIRNIERVWKAEEKEKEENRKLDELRKNIKEEKERDEFRLLQQQAGFAPIQERLEFLYDSGLSVGKTSNEGFAALQSDPLAAQISNSATAAPSSNDSSALGALFEEKPQSANDAWRKLHSDPLLMIRQREQEALARIKNNPVKMAMIRKSVETQKKDDEAFDDGKQKKFKSKHKRHSSSKHQPETGNESDQDNGRKRKSKLVGKDHEDSDEDFRDGQKKVKSKHKRHSSSKLRSDNESDSDKDKERKRKPKLKGMERASDEDSSDRERQHRRSHIDNGSKKFGSPKNKKDDRNVELEKDHRNGDRRHFHRDIGSGKGHRSFDDHKNERNEDHEQSQRGNDRSRDEKYPSASHDKRKNERNDDREHSRRGNDRSRDEKYPSASHDKGINERNDDLEQSRRANERSKDGKYPSDSRDKQKNERNDDREQSRRLNERSKDEKYPSDSHYKHASSTIDHTSSSQTTSSKHAAAPPNRDSYRGRGKAPQLSAEERAARLKEMQMDAELHEEQRWKRLKKAAEDDAREASKASTSHGKSFLDAVHKSVYGAEKGGSSTIEESVRRRSHFLQGRTQVDEQNAFRR